MKANNKRARPAHRKSSLAWKPWNEDVILRQVYAIRDSYAREHGYDLDRIARELKGRERAHGSESFSR